MGSAPHVSWDDLLTAAHVWCALIDAQPAGWESRCLKWLEPQERARLDRLATASLRQAFLATRALRRATLSRYADVKPATWIFTSGEYGKPAIAEPAAFSSLRFNASRTRGLVVCAVTRAGEIGVDVEETTREVDAAQVARHFFSAEEQAAMAAAPASRQTAMFFEQWVLKEAYLKGVGTGLSRSPEDVSIERDADGAPRPIDDWRLSLHHPSARHVAAVAVTKRIPVLWWAADPF